MEPTSMTCRRPFAESRSTHGAARPSSSSTSRDSTSP